MVRAALPALPALSGLLLGALAILLWPAASLFVAGTAGDDGREPGVRWACAMIDWVGETRGSGRCPVCGMKLERITAGALAAEQRRRMGVETAVIAAGHARMTVRAYGAARYDLRGQRVVVARIAGRVVRRHPAMLHDASDVAVGEALVDLYSPEALQAQHELLAAKRFGDLVLVEALSARFTRWNLAALATAVLAGTPPVDIITIASPFAGRVQVDGSADDNHGGKVALPHVGEEITADRPLVSLVDPERFMIVVHVPEPQARFLRLDQRVRLASDDAGELDVDARLSWLAPELDPEIRARAVHIHVEDGKRRLFAGSLMLARIEVALGPELEPADPKQPDSWGSFALIPKSAVLSTGVRNVAWKLVADEGGRQRFVPVSLALGPRLEDPAGHDRYVVRSGLAAGDVVAVQGAFLIDSQAQLVGSPSLLYPDGAVAGATK